MRITEKLQRRVSALMWITVGTVLLSVLLGGVLFLEMIETMGSEQRQEVGQLLELEESLGKARTEFLEQIREWKDSLLRARDPALFAKHQAAFKTHDAAVTVALHHAKTVMQTLHMDAAPIEAIAQLHMELTLHYQQALQLLDAQNPMSFELVDRQVRGQDRLLLEHMEQRYEHFDSMITEHVIGLGVIAETGGAGARFRALGVLALLLALVALISFFISYRAMHQLGRGARRERAVFDGIGDVVVVLDLHGRVRSLNLQGRHLAGLAEDKVNDRAVADVLLLVNEVTPHPVELALSQVRQTGQRVDLASGTQLRRKAGSQIDIEGAVTPMADVRGDLFGAVLVFRDVTQQRQTLRLLKTNEEQLRLTLKGAADAIFITEQNGRIVYVNDTVINLLGYSRDELTRMSAFDLVPFEWRERYKTGSASILTGHERQVFEIRLLRKDGALVPMELNVVLLPDGNVYGSCRDITDRKQTEMALNKQLDYFKALHQLAQVIADDEQADALLKTAVLIIGKTLALDRALIYEISFEHRQVKGLCEWLNPLHPDTLPTLSTYPLDFFIGGATELLRTRQYQTSQVDAVNPCLVEDGSGVLLHQQMMVQSALWYPFDFTHHDSFQVLTLNQVHRQRTWTQAEVDFIAAVCQQLSIALNKLTMLGAKQRADEKIEQLVFLDPLTGLPNRVMLLNKLQHARTAAQHHQVHGALLLVDLDNFKILNETLGHAHGDGLLVQVAGRLSGCLREGNTVARLTGDKFAVLLEKLSLNEFEAREQAQEVGQKILSRLSEIYQLSGGVHHGSASIGMTLFGKSVTETTDDPLKRAELAMYQAKWAGRNTMRFFEAQMQEVVSLRADLEADLRAAVLNDQFVLYYQAQVSGVGRMTGAEVLVRWLHPQRGLVSPAEFIPLAEDTGLILPLGHWVLENACTQLALWATHPKMAHFTLAVNVSARQFRQDNFVDQVLAVLERTGANPQQLKLELTESMLVLDVENTIAKMDRIKARGITFSLDDFGTGYSSLAYLKRLPLDQLKIDQGFVRNILTDTNDSAIAKMVIALAESMGLGVIAEGVEQQEQADLLAHMGCHAYQGYLFSRPVPLDAFEMLASQMSSLD